MNSRSLLPLALLSQRAGVKSVDVHRTTGRVVVSEWKSTLHLLSPEAEIDLQPAHPYKARWLPE